MSIALVHGVTLTVEAALSAATGSYGVWGAAASTWGSATWGPDETWSDITPWVRGFSTTRGFSRSIQAWQAGTATVVLDNRDARFSADNLAGPYVTAGVSGVRPLRPIRISVAYGGTTYPLWRGLVTEWPESYPGDMPSGSRGDAIVTARCVDVWSVLAAYDGPELPAVGAGELFGRRVHRILDNAGHAGSRDIDTGTVTMQATTLASNAVSELKLAADSEGGAVWVGPDGTIVGRRQYSLVEDSRSVNIQATFGDDIAGGELPYADLTLTYDGDLVANKISWARAGSTAQSAADPTSRALYGDRTDTRTDLVCETDAQVAALAAWRLATSKDPEKRIEQIVIKPRRSPASLWPQVLGREVRDLIRVIRRPPGLSSGITRDCFIAGISHSMVIQTGAWTTTFDLWSATPYRAFATSRWDVGLWDSALWFY